MAAIVFVLCAATAFLCALLLLRGYQRGRSPLLLWASLCFFGLTANNLLLYVDLVIVPSVDLSIWRHLIALVSVSLLIFGLIWEGMSAAERSGRSDGGGPP